MSRFFEKLRDVKPRDFLHIFLFIFALPIALVYKRFRKDLWLVCDNGTEATDNGFCFFEYVCRNHPEQDCVYAVYKTSVDYENVKKTGKTVKYGSFAHWILYLTARVNISSQKGGKPNYAVCYLLEVYGILHNNRVFLQHGVILTNIEFLYYKNTKMSMFVTSTYREWEYVSQNYGYPEGTVKLLGLTLWDKLHDFKTVPNQILIMPTWRDWIGTDALSKSIEDDKKAFCESDYFKNWSKIINSSRLEEICRKYGCTVMFYPHRDMQRFIDCFSKSNPYLTICKYPEYTVQELMKSSAFMITDYSSVQIDFAYMKKPLAYFQFDYERFSQHHYGKGYFDYAEDGFGPVYNDEQGLMDYIEQMAQRSFENTELYLSRHRDFFDLYDTENSKRNYEAVRERWH